MAARPRTDVPPAEPGRCCVQVPASNPKAVPHSRLQRPRAVPDISRYGESTSSRGLPEIPYRHQRRVRLRGAGGCHTHAPALRATRAGHSRTPTPCSSSAQGPLPLCLRLQGVGWQRLFPEGQRPEALTLAAAGGAASVGGVALPGRFDEAIRIAVVRRGPGKKTAGLGSICLTLIIVGLLDSAALHADGVDRCSRVASRWHAGGLRARRSRRCRGSAAGSVTAPYRQDGLRQPLEGRPLAEGPHRVPSAPRRRPGS